MPWWVWTITGVVGVGVSVVTEVMRRRWDVRQRVRFAGWDGMSISDKIECLRELKIETLEREGKRTRNDVLEWALLIWFIPVSLYLAVDNSDDAERASDDAGRGTGLALAAIDLLCDDSRGFRELLADETRQDLARLVAERDDLGERIQATPADLREQFPGLADLPGFDRYLADYIGRAQEDLADMNMEILVLRDRAATIETAAAEPCPPESLGIPTTRLSGG